MTVSRSDPSQMTRYEWNLPTWLKEGLFELAVQKKKNVNQLLTETVLKEYPFLKEKNRSIIKRLLSPSPNARPLETP